MKNWYIYVCPECGYRINTLDKITVRVHCPSFPCRKTITPQLVDIKAA
jgi:DNA-directed RNA polymerase subunit RPC12/RpoP